MDNKIEKILWSIAIPGFSQLLNGKFLKGLLFIALEFWINNHAHLNEVIALGFQGDIAGSVQIVNLQWLMFYPCVYMYAMWDAYKDAGGGASPYVVIPFVFGVYFGTIGVIFSYSFLGPVWLGIIGAFVGIGIGILLRSVFITTTPVNKHEMQQPLHEDVPFKGETDFDYRK